MTGTHPPSGPKTWTLSPSDFAFLWEECKCCFYLKLVRNFKRPSTPFPGIFSKIGGLQKTFFDGKQTQELVPELPPGRFAYGEKWVVSQPIAPVGRKSVAIIRGRFDVVVEFENGTYGVIDFKTAAPQASNVAKYGRQLHSYAHALENPGPRGLALSPVSLLGLLCLDPANMVRGQAGRNYYLQCLPTWLPCPRDEAAFVAFVGEMLDVLDLPEPPPPSSGCSFCTYRSDARSTGL
jgi:hypothetical protein